MTVINSGESDEEADPIGAMTENNGGCDVEGQLQAGIDKVAGDLVHRHLCRSCKNKLFSQIGD